MEAIDYVKNTDDRIVILMELNAWAIVLHENLQDLRKFLKDEGNLLSMFIHIMDIFMIFSRKKYVRNFISFKSIILNYTISRPE